MNKNRLFQVFVGASTAIYIAYFFSAYWSPELSDTEQLILSYNGCRSIISLDNIIYYGIFFGLWLIASIGMLLFKNWSRHLYLTLTIIGLALIPFSGISVQTSLDAMLASTSLLLDGVVLAMAYLSSVSMKFKTDMSKTTTQPTQ